MSESVSDEDLQTVHSTEILIPLENPIIYEVEVFAGCRLIEVSKIREEIDILIGCGITKQELFTHQLAISLNSKIVTVRRDHQAGFQTTCIGFPPKK